MHWESQIPIIYLTKGWLYVITGNQYVPLCTFYNPDPNYGFATAVLWSLKFWNY